MNKNNHLQKLTPTDLRRKCDPASLRFKSTAELPDLEGIIGQPRALRAMELGSEVTGPGYNTFVLGAPGSGRTTLSREYLERKAGLEPAPDDWCYVYNFDSPRNPRALRLPPGWGNTLRRDIEEFIDRCKKDIANAFQSEEYHQERDRLAKEIKKNTEAEFIRLQKYVEQHSFLIARTTFGFVLVPAVNGEPLKPEDLEKLSPEKQAKLKKLQENLSGEVDKTLQRLREMERAASEQLGELNKRTILFRIEPLLEALKAKYAAHPPVQAHFDAIRADMVANVDRFKLPENGDDKLQAEKLAQPYWFRRYAVNVLVDNSALQGAPVVVENHPSYPNLLGSIEHEMAFGATRTDFSMIRPGALHRANGGYLILPARDLLVNTYAWEGIKRVLRDNEIRIVELASQLGLLTSVTLEPDPIPLNIKIYLVGTPLLYYMLRSYDEDFAKLFKVRAEFAASMVRTPETEHEYGLFVKSVVDDNQLPHFEASAVARIIEHSSRLVEDKNRLSTQFGKIADLIREAAYWSGKNQEEGQTGSRHLVQASDVQRAIEESVYRSNLLEERIQEMISTGTLRIEVSGKTVGQVNALSVVSLGDYTFGRPSRVTASAYPGRGGVVDIERQANLGGPIHTKGVLILSGLLGERYALQEPLSLSAHLTFEQTYEGVEGDSAAVAELYALLSAIAQIPLRQDHAITGSVNQHGEIQAIGGVNEKIEGFFATCQALGLNGEQGVIIPTSNVEHLMLNEEVCAAIAEGKFSIWAINTIDEGLQLLSDIEAGTRQEDGSYPEGTFHHAVAAGLQTFASAVKGREAQDEQNDEEDK